MKKFAASVAGFIAGIVSLPLMIIAWPVTVAWFCWSEMDD